MKHIPGYTYDQPDLPASPITLDDLDLLKKTLLWSDDDDRHLRLAGDVLAGQTSDILDVWYGYVGSHPHLLHYFTHQGAPQPDYLAAVRARFEQWILDLCQRPYDARWLSYQFEIALRHHSTGKNRTDGATSVPIVHYRYIVAFIYPISVTIRPFLEKGGHAPEVTEGMYQAWCKAVTLTAILWTYPYIRENEF